MKKTLKNRKPSGQPDNEGYINPYAHLDRHIAIGRSRRSGKWFRLFSVGDADAGRQTLARPGAQ